MRNSWMVLVLIVAQAPQARADIVCPDDSYATVTFTQVFTGNYRNGEARDVVTVAPQGGLESLASNGVTIDVYLRTCAGAPLAGVPRQEIVVFNSALCFCPGGNMADADTDAAGHTTFTGQILAGGCATNLWVFADGIGIATLPVKVNSPDLIPASPCFVDASDLSSLAANRGSTTNICFDWNEDGISDASDLSYFAALRGSSCQ